MRLFIGVAPDKAARDALAETARLLRQQTAGHYLHASMYHLTLAFLGEVEADGLPAIYAAMEAAARATEPFAVALGHIGAFGAALWRGTLRDERLSGLADALRAALGAAGIAYDPKPFRPHITLARDAKWQGDTPAALPDAMLAVRRLTLFQSVREGGRLRYARRRHCPLGMAHIYTEAR